MQGLPGVEVLLVLLVQPHLHHPLEVPGDQVLAPHLCITHVYYLSIIYLPLTSLAKLPMEYGTLAL